MDGYWHRPLEQQSQDASFPHDIGDDEWSHNDIADDQLLFGHGDDLQ